MELPCHVLFCLWRWYVCVSDVDTYHLTQVMHQANTWVHALPSTTCLALPHHHRLQTGDSSIPPGARWRLVSGDLLPHACPTYVPAQP